MHRTGHRWMARCSISLANGTREGLFGWGGQVANVQPRAMCPSSSMQRTEMVGMVASTVERLWRENDQVHSETLQDVQVGGSHCEQFRERDWGWLRLECPQILWMVGFRSRLGDSGEHSSRMDAMDSLYQVGPGALNEYADAFMGPSAPGESHGSQPRSKGTVVWICGTELD